MGQRIGGTDTSGLQLRNAAQDPVTILSGAQIVTSDRYAILGSTLLSWTVINDGALAAELDAVRLMAGGTVTNAMTASISGGSVGILVDGATGAVSSLGTITAGSSTLSVGISLGSGGSVINGSATDATALVQGGVGVSVSGAAGTITNYGRIVGSDGTAVSLNAGGAVINAGPNASIVGGVALNNGTLINGSAGAEGASVSGGVELSGASNMTNYGLIGGGANPVGNNIVNNEGTLSGGVDAYTVYSFLSLTNTGVLDGGINVGGFNDSQVITNAGTISGGMSLGFSPQYSFGTITNTGLIFGGVGLSGFGYVHNSGTIANDSGVGVYIYQSFAPTTNGTAVGSRAVITGTVGVYGADKLINFGTVIGTDGVAAENVGVVVVEPESVFTGEVIGGSGFVNTPIYLELASASITGTIGGIGAGSFTNFGTIVVGAGAGWTMIGANTLTNGALVSLASAGALTVSGSLSAGPVLALSGSGTLGVAATGIVEVGAVGSAALGRITVDPGATLIGSGVLGGAISDGGMVEAQGGILRLLGAVSGRGTVAIDTGATLIASGNLKPDAIRFVAGGTELLELNRPVSLASTISGFGVVGAGDRIDLLNFVATASAFSGTTLTLTGAGGVATLRFAGSYALSSFHVTSDHHSGTNLTFV